MNQDLLIEKSIMVRMNETSISTDDKPIIGTKGLATCVGVLLYSEENKRAIVSHVSSDVSIAVRSILDLIDINKLDTSVIKYVVISGYYDEHYNVKDTLEKFFDSYPLLFAPFDINEVGENIVRVDQGIKVSYEFAFDASIGKFITDIYPFDVVKNDGERFIR